MKKLFVRLNFILFMGAVPCVTQALEQYTMVKSPYKDTQLKEWTVLIYMAADNDLLPFADRNIEQLKQVGSTANLNILVHLHTHRPRSNKVTKKLCIQKDRVLQIGPDECKDSGSEQTLIEACKWAISDFKAKNFVLVFWNHGSGDINPLRGKSINPSVLFTYNTQKNILELDRSIGLLDLVESLESPRHRGVCFDETTGNYLNDEKLKIAFESVCAILGRKIDYILWDTCMMGGIGTVHNCSKYAKRIVASEEVVLGTGYNYSKLLKPLAANEIRLDQLAKHVVTTYEETYSKITNDYTQAAIELERYPALQKNVDTLARLLIDALEKQKDKTVYTALKQSRDRNQCTHFWEPSYIDLAHLYLNILKNMPTMQLRQGFDEPLFKNSLSATIHEGLALIDSLVIANSSGRNYKKASGISIYFPEYALHPTYPSTEFAKNTNWANFIKMYLRK